MLDENLPTAESTASRPTAEPPASKNSGLQRAVLVYCLAGGVLGISALTISQVIAIWRQDQWMVTILSNHYAVLAGVPIATFVALAVVILLEARYDDIKMELFNGALKFEGAAGPIIMWVICFLSIAGSIKLLW